MVTEQSIDGGLRELALFAGAGGGLLGGHLLGWRTVCAVEWDAYAASVLVARQNDGCLPPFAVWDNVQNFDGRPWRGRVDVVSGGFPCQDLSCAGKGAGIDGERSGMWKHMARIIGEVRPRYVFVENSPMLVGRGLARVLGDLAKMGMDARWGVVGAHHAGAPHKRDRIWIVADAGRPHGVGGQGERHAAHRQEAIGVEETGDDQRRGEMGHATVEGLEGGTGQGMPGEGGPPVEPPGADWWATEPAVCGVADGMADQLDQHGAIAAGYMGRVATGIPHRNGQLRCLGNGQVPLAAALAWKMLSEDCP